MTSVTTASDWLRGLNTEGAIAQESVLTGGELPDLWAEVMEYHFGRRSDEMADLLLQNADEASPNPSELKGC